MVTAYKVLSSFSAILLFDYELATGTYKAFNEMELYRVGFRHFTKALIGDSSGMKFQTLLLHVRI